MTCPDPPPSPPEPRDSKLLAYMQAQDEARVKARHHLRANLQAVGLLLAVGGFLTPFQELNGLLLLVGVPMLIIGLCIPPIKPVKLPPE